MVVCSRSADYEKLTKRLKLNGAVVLQPLSPEQIDSYFAGAGEELQTVQVALQTNIELQELAQSLAIVQPEDGFWRTNLMQPDLYPNPESSGTAFFTFGLSWGINNGYLDQDKFLPVIRKSWSALYHIVDEDGKVRWGQDVSRDPGKVKMSDSHEFVAGAFLLAGSEVLNLSICQAPD